jgi:putative ABC transport system permease protein
MMRRAGELVARRWRAMTGSASAAAVALGLLACLCTLLAVVGPRAGAQLRTGAFRQFIAAEPATEKAVIGSVPDNTLGLGDPQGLTAGDIARSRSQMRANLRTLPLAPVAADWSSLTTPLLLVTDNAGSLAATLPPKLELTYRDTLAGNVRVMAGRLPSATASLGSTVLIQGAVTSATALRYGVAVGSRLDLPGTSIVLDVTAIVTPRDRGAPFWTVDPAAAAPQFINVDPNNGYWEGAVFIPASAVIALQSRIDASSTQVTWMFPLAIGNFTAAQAAQLQSTLAGTLETAGHLSLGNSRGQSIPVLITLTSGTGGLIAAFSAEAASVASVVDLLAVSLAVLAAVVVLLAGWLLTEQRRQEFALLRARGASLRQLALGVLAGSAVTVLPGAAIGAALAVVFTPTAPVALSWYLAGLEVLAALAGPAAMTVRVHRGYAASTRSDQPPGRVFAARRLVVEAALVLGSVGGVAVLHYQGSSSGTDVYPAAAPVLLALAVAVVVVRLYPLAVRGVLALTGQRASAAAFLGLARAARASGSTALPAFALVLALALASFAGMVRSAVLSGEVSSSWQQAGADVVISAPDIVSDALRRAVAAVPGVQQVTAAGIAPAGTTGGQEFAVLTVDPGQYRALLAGTPLPQVPPAFAARARGGAVPALAPPSVAAEVGSGPVNVLGSYDDIRVRVIGRAASMSALSGQSGGYLVLPRQALGGAAPAPNVLLVRGRNLNRAALSAAVARYGRGATLLVRSEVLAGLETAPLQHGAYLALALGGAAAVACGLLVLLLSLLLSAPSRQLSLARMSTMGLSAAQGRLVAVLEAVPQLLAVLVGGTATAAALGPLLGPALGLSVFTGSASSVPVRIEPIWLVAAAAAMLVLAIVTLTGQSAVTSHNAARSVRMEG